MTKRPSDLQLLHLVLGEAVAAELEGELTEAQRDELLALLEPARVWLDRTYGPLPFRWIMEDESAG